MAAHLLGGYTLYNGPAQKCADNTYMLSPQSSINSIIPVHVFTPYEPKLSNEFAEVCRSFSKIVQARKLHSFGMTIKSQLFDLINSKTEKTKKMNQCRFVTHTFWTNNEVRNQLSAIFINILGKVFCLTVLFFIIIIFLD